MGRWTTKIQLRNNTNTKSIETEVIKVRRGIFQGDSLSALWFCIALNPLSTILNETQKGFNIRNNKRALHQVTHLMYMDIKLYAPSREKMQQLIQLVQTFSEDICMKFGLEKC